MSSSRIFTLALTVAEILAFTIFYRERLGQGHVVQYLQCTILDHLTKTCLDGAWLKAKPAVAYLRKKV